MPERDQEIMNRVQKRIAYLRYYRDNIILVVALISVVPAILVLSVSENRSNLTILEFLELFTLGFQFLYLGIKWTASSVYDLALNLPSFVMSEWRFMFLIFGIIVGLYYAGSLYREKGKALKQSISNNQKMQVALELASREIDAVDVQSDDLDEVSLIIFTDEELASHFYGLENKQRQLEDELAAKVDAYESKFAICERQLSDHLHEEERRAYGYPAWTDHSCEFLSVDELLAEQSRLGKKLQQLDGQLVEILNEYSLNIAWSKENLEDTDIESGKRIETQVENVKSQLQNYLEQLACIERAIIENDD
jgi:hypothetical protein